jgi:hypothetical protein
MVRGGSFHESPKLPTGQIPQSVAKEGTCGGHHLRGAPRREKKELLQRPLPVPGSRKGLAEEEERIRVLGV